MGPRRLLGYREMHLKIKNIHGLNVPRDLVYAAMIDFHSYGLKMRQPGNKKPWVMSLDGHDELVGFQNNTFPIAIYGAIDTASRKVLCIKVWVTNSIPELVTRWYFELVYETRVMPNYIRTDKGSETGTIATMHCFLRRPHLDVETDEDAVKTVIYGPSTSNQVVLLNVIDMYGVEQNKRCFRVNEKIMPVVTCFVFCSSHSYTQKITSRYFMLLFYALILCFIVKFFQNQCKKSISLR